MAAVARANTERTRSSVRKPPPSSRFSGESSIITKFLDEVTAFTQVNQSIHPSIDPASQQAIIRITMSEHEQRARGRRYIRTTHDSPSSGSPQPQRQTQTYTKPSFPQHLRSRNPIDNLRIRFSSPPLQNKALLPTPGPSMTHLH